MVKLYEAGSRLSDIPGEAGKCRGNFLHMNRPLGPFHSFANHELLGLLVTLNLPTCLMLVR